MGFSYVWTEKLRRNRDISDGLLCNDTSLAYALISFSHKNSSDHVISPNAHFVLRRNINVLAKRLLQMSALVETQCVRFDCFSGCYFYRPAERESRCDNNSFHFSKM